MVHLSRVDICYGLCSVPFRAEERLGLSHVARVLARLFDILLELAILRSWIPVVVRQNK